ncbi:FAD-binding oxidoreductase [Mycobacterium simiae]|uniref:FAD-binding oxidoreductase n=1 Tax=Mycobacterium simiae TaxID=1784 RepID=UPI000B1F8450|nr:FAD-dependent oxidoreductase [Mycobacterium simiae]
MSTTDVITAAADDLASRVKATQVRVPDDAPLIWNAAVHHHPALIMQAESPRDVREAIRVARDHGLPLSVLGGGHDWAGRAVRDGGLVIDMSGMRSAAVDPGARVATVGGGLVASELIDAVARYGLVAATGNCGGVGMTGLTLGGGYGPLNGRFGALPWTTCSAPKLCWRMAESSQPTRLGSQSCSGHCVVVAATLEWSLRCVCGCIRWIG